MAVDGDDLVLVVDVDDDRRVGLQVALVVGAEGGDDDLVARPGQVGRGAVDLHRARAGLAVDHVGDEAGAVVDVPDVDLLVGDQVGAGHQLGVDGDAADVVHVAVGHRCPVDLGLEHLPLHQMLPPCQLSVVERFKVRIRTLSISRAPPTRAATATRTGRPFELGHRRRGSRRRAPPGTRARSRRRATRAAGLEGGGQRLRRGRLARPRAGPARAPSPARGPRARGRRCASSSPVRRPRARSAAPRFAPGSRGRATMRRMTATCWASFWPK